jgi:NDP-sugar pyrophosphorylase family protein
MMPILVVLAAGIGSRYGALKQMDRVGRGGETMLHFSVFDAMRAGFERVVFVIRRAIEHDFSEVVLKRLDSSVKYSLAFQELDALIPPDLWQQAQANGRTQPWGTAHALLCAEGQLDAPFLVINSDDFYGREAFAAMGHFLSDPAVANGAIVTYMLGKTLSSTGTVTRGVCVVKDGFLKSVEEFHKIEKKGTIIFNTSPDGKKRQFMPDTPVSMNFWGFPVGALAKIKDFFYQYLKHLVLTRQHECYLPLAADWLVKNNLLKIQSLKTASEWFGITWQEDRQHAIARIMDLNRMGVYPSPLWQ